MKRLVIVVASAAGACAIAVPAALGLSHQPTYSQRIPIRVPSTAQVVTFDDHGTAGDGDVLRSSHTPSPTASSTSRGRAAEPGDDNGTHAEPTDDNGTHAEPTDDNGTHAEPADDKATQAAPADDKRGQASSTPAKTATSAPSDDASGHDRGNDNGGHGHGGDGGA